MSDEAHGRHAEGAEESFEAVSEVAPVPAALAPLRRQGSLVPQRSIAGRSLVMVIAIMTFLACLAAGAAHLVSRAVNDWTTSIASEMSIEVRPLPGRDLEADVAASAEAARNTKGIAVVKVFTRAESEALLEPWIGTGLDVTDLPIPRMITLTREPNARPDVADLSRRLALIGPSASLDDHRAFISRLSSMANALIAVAIGVVGLVLSASALAVGFATRSAVALNHEVVEVLHLVGADDDFVAREFQRRFLALGIEGGALGAAAAAVCFFIAGILSTKFASTAAADQMEAVFGSFQFGTGGYALIASVAIAVAYSTAIVSRLTVKRRLRSMA
ncbi:MAG: cell division protein FtsX [Hyphomicrobiales bacterium]